MNLVLKSIIEKKRKEFARLSSGRSIPLQATDGVSEYRDCQYLQDGDPAHTVDIFCPHTAIEPLPVIINIHGGGLIMGNKEFNRHFCLKLCQCGFIVFSVEYSLCPEATVFNQLQDIYAAMNYIGDLLPQFHAETGHVFMVGDSAGAFLAYYAAAIQQNPILSKASGLRPPDLIIRSLGLISGMFYTTRCDSIGMVFPVAFYGKRYRELAFYPYLNPENPEVSMFLPPCLLITSKADKLRHYTTDLAAALRRNRSPFILRDYGGDPNLYHAFSVFDPELPESQHVIEDIASFFREYE